MNDNRTEESVFFDTLIDFLIAALNLTKKYRTLSKNAKGENEYGEEHTA